MLHAETEPSFFKEWLDSTMDPEEKLIRELSDKAFRNHEITERMRQGVFRSWRCKPPDSWSYGFDITTTPGFIFVTGDIGDLIVQREYDMLPWCRGSCDSTHYFSTKVPHAIKTTEFSHAALERWIEDEMSADDIDERYESVLIDAIGGGVHEHGPEHWYAEFAEFLDGDYPSWDVWNSNFLWCRDAIRWFVNNHREDGVQQ